MKTAGNHDIAVLIEFYLDGECSPAEKKVLEDAISDDPALRSEIQQAQQMRNALARDSQSLSLPAGDKLSFMSKVSGVPGGVGAGISASVGAAAMFGVSATPHLGEDASSAAADEAAAVQTQAVSTSGSGALQSSGILQGIIQKVLQPASQVVSAGFGGWLASAGAMVTMFFVSAVEMPQVSESQAFQSLNRAAFSQEARPQAAQLQGQTSTRENYRSDQPHGAAAASENQYSTENSHSPSASELEGHTDGRTDHRSDHSLGNNAATAPHAADASANFGNGNASGANHGANNLGNSPAPQSDKSDAAANAPAADAPEQSSNAGANLAPAEQASAEASAPPSASLQSIVTISGAEMFAHDAAQTAPQLPQSNSATPQTLQELELRVPAADRWKLLFSTGLLVSTSEGMPAMNQADINGGLQFVVNDELNLMLEGGQESVSLVELSGQYFIDVERINYVLGGVNYSPLVLRFEAVQPYFTLAAGVSDSGLLLKTRLGLSRPLLGPVGIHAAIELGGLSGSWQDVNKVSLLSGLSYRF